MPTVVTINRPDVVELISVAADRFTGGNKTEAVAMAMRALIEKRERKGSLFGLHKGLVIIPEDSDLIAPTDGEPWDAETGAEIDR